MTTQTTPDEITCVGCRARFDGVPVNEHGFAMLDLTYECGNRAQVSLGHQLMFTRTGRTALCIIPARPAIRATRGAVETDYPHDDYSAIVSVGVIVDGQPAGEVWVRAGVPQSLEGTARAAGSAHGMETVQPYGDTRDTWCPDALADVDPDAIMDAVREAAITAWRDGA